MLKEYKIPLAIVISSIIISLTIWYTQTYKDRAKYNYCIESTIESIDEKKLNQDLRDKVNYACYLQTYIER